MKRSVSVLVAALTGMIVAYVAFGVWRLLLAVFSDYSSTAVPAMVLLLSAILGALFRTVHLAPNSFPPWLRRPPGRIASLAGAAWIVHSVVSSFTPFGMGTVTVWGTGGVLVGWIVVAFTLESIFRAVPRTDTTKTELMYTSVGGLQAFGFLFYMIIALFPFYFMIASSMKSRAVFLQNPSNLAIDFSRGLGSVLQGYTEVIIRFNFGRYIFNSTFVALFTVVITLVPAILGAYAVTRLNFKGRDVLSRSILLIYMFPAIVLVIPLYSVFSQLGLRDTLPGLLVVYPAMTIPVALYMLRSYFLTLPKDIEEAGLIDGCTRFEVIWRITLPLSVPALASVGLYVFMIAWNEFLFAFMFLDSPEIFTLSRGVVSLNSQEVPRQFLMAGAVIITVPIMVLFFWFERFLVGGLSAGGVKG
ncbi:MAG: carbohydrate ABC transporter permease [Alkalispirochaeta sp.]